ncbi:MAG: hypothetical protein R3B45_12455 [Bdellovibrionota bacterium]
MLFKSLKNIITANATLLLVLSNSGCGVQQQETPVEEEKVVHESTDNQTTPIQNTSIAEEITSSEEANLAQEFAALPTGVMIKVPVDANGNELSEEAEIKAYTGAEISEENADQAWSTSMTTNELDEESLDQAFLNVENSSNLARGNGQGNRGGNRGNRGYRQMNNRHNQGNYYNNNYNNGRGSQLGGYYRNYRHGRNYGYNSGYYTNYYRPIWYSNAYSYGYWGYNNRPRCYNRYGYRYYYYPRPHCMGYYFCGGYGY